MKLLDREVTTVAHWVLDNIVPPFIRDRFWFMYPFVWIAHGKSTKVVMEFKKEVPFLSDEEIATYYDPIKDKGVKRPTDLNKKSLNYIVKNLFKDGEGEGNFVLDIACGNGFLLKKIMEAYPNKKCTGADIDLPDISAEFEMVKANIISLPFADKSFDNVTCTHTLEHIKDPQKALSELLRVTKHRLIIVVPRQREYLYTPDPHINFFPYMHTFKRFIGIKNAVYLQIGGDFCCKIDL
jgi:ubiquinone/menaquinone biosynthesis C-methylase UbiE